MNPVLERHRTHARVSKKAASYAKPGISLGGFSSPSRSSSSSSSSDGGGHQVVFSEDELCAWINCEKGPDAGRAPRRKNSKYCSRQCSNKNARSRFRSRKGPPGTP
jgi:hypothetical protein